MAEASNILRDQCLGLASCTPNFQALGSDPCPGHVKWMDAAWECAAPQAGGRALIAVSHTLLLIMGLVLIALRLRHFQINATSPLLLQVSQHTPDQLVSDMKVVLEVCFLA